MPAGTYGTKAQGSQTNIFGKVSDVTFFDIKRFMARLAARKLFALGIKVQSENPRIQEFLNDFLETNKMADLLIQASEDAAYGGRVFLTLDKTKTNNIIVSYINNQLLQNVEKMEITPFMADLLRKRVIGLNIFFIREIWTLVDITRTFDIRDAKTGQSVEWTAEMKVPEEFNLPAYERHNLGFIPFEEHTNKPARNIVQTNAEGDQYLQDDFSVRFLAAHINNGLRQWYKEEVLGKTRVYGVMSETALNKLRTHEDNPALKDLFIDTMPSPNQTKSIEVAPASYNASPWNEAMKAKINLYAIGCGYSPIFKDSGDMTEAETLISKDADIQYTKEKRRRWTETLNSLFAKILVYSGNASDIKAATKLFTLEIRENVVYNKMQLTDFLAANVANGFMTQVEAIMLQRDIDSQEEAEEIWKAIQKDREEAAQFEIEQQTELIKKTSEVQAQGNGGGMGAMKKGGDPAKGSDASVKANKEG